MNTGLSNVIEAIAGDILMLAQLVMDDDGVGGNRKTGANTLKDSALLQQTKVDITNRDNSVVIDILFDHYIEYIEKGRKPRSGKQPPIDALRDWALARNIPTDNSTLFLISRAIWRDGFEGRPVLSTLEEEIGRHFDEEWAGKIYEAMVAEIDKLFSNG